MAIVNGPGPATMENAITDHEMLFDELEATRMQVYANNNEELQIGFRSIAAPLTFLNGP